VRAWFKTTVGLVVCSEANKVSLAVIVGVGILVFLLMYFTSIIDREKHKHIRTFFLMISLPLLFLIPASLILDQEVCEIVLSNDSEIFVYGNYFDDYHWDGYNITAPSQTDKEAFLFHTDKTYSYETFCYEKRNGSAAFFKAFAIILVVFMIYIGFIFFADIIGWLKKIMKKV